MNWISFDWDYVTGDGAETVPVKSYDIREDIPAPRTLMTPIDGWQERLQQVKDLLEMSVISLVVVGELHDQIYELLQPGDVVWNIDAHSDDYLNDKGVVDSEIHAGNWVSHAIANGIDVQQLGEDVLSEFQPPPSVALFVALSPDCACSELDHEMEKLLEAIVKMVISK